jgi:hypothetical protein
MVENRASAFLSDHEVTAERLMAQLRRAPTENSRAMDRIMDRASDTAITTHSPHVSSLHCLVALLSIVDSAAYRMVSALDLDIGTIRSTAMAHLREPLEQWDPNIDEPNDASDTVSVNVPRSVPAALPQPARSVTATLETEADERDHADGIREPDDVRRERRRRAQENRRPVRPRRPSRADTTKDLAKRLFDTGPRASDGLAR